MGNLVFFGLYQINGVLVLYIELMCEIVFYDLYCFYLQCISNKINGVLFCCWLFQVNLGLIELLVEIFGVDLLDILEWCLLDFEEYVEDVRLWVCFVEQCWQNKIVLVCLVLDSFGVVIELEVLFDVYIKCIYEYKWQLFNLLYIVVLYQEICNDLIVDCVLWVKIFVGKVVVSYYQVKLIIKLVNDIVCIINDDFIVCGLFKLVFLFNYNVSLVEVIIFVVDFFEQIFIVGFEVFGISNMKFVFNGVLIIGILDGVNVEMSQWIGLEYMFIFGFSVQQVEQCWQVGELEMGGVIVVLLWLEEVLEVICSGLFLVDDCSCYEGLVDGLVYDDCFMFCVDFEVYWYVQCWVEEVWCEFDCWWCLVLFNVVWIGWFSVDWMISEYVWDIWKL